MVHDTPTWYDTTVAEKGLAAAAKSCTFKYGQKRARPTREVYRQQTTWRIEYRQTTQHSVMEHAQSSTNWTRTPSSVHFVKGPGHTQPSHVHYVLHVLIKFSLQYAWYFAMEASFDFSIHDMSLLRRWWCVILVENFGLEGCPWTLMRTTPITRGLTASFLKSRKMELCSHDLAKNMSEEAHQRLKDL
ncbi:uncharacterized protein LOC117538676 isoform X3 [Gymnodraco acuticeps]|uniref:Uncharacterized protein LOC117538676 isoform X3 n=1 Tax=Gymnodraco acuticeps TaxID=8218 RepID=A0A6P8T9H8_GYMAC|nr:uncharacterized protein LOC117538676 isoform X3 [Gymnodraco acuticeps]